MQPPLIVPFFGKGTESWSEPLGSASKPTKIRIAFSLSLYTTFCTIILFKCAEQLICIDSSDHSTNNAKVPKISVCWYLIKRGSLNIRAR